MDRIRLAGRLLKVGVALIFLASVGAVLGLWLYGPVVGDNFIVLAETKPVDGRQLVGLLTAMPSLVSWLTALTAIHRVFDRFAVGEIVSNETVRGMRRFGGFALLSVFLAVITSGAHRWALGQTGEGGPFTHVGIEEAQLVLGFMALMMFVTSHGLAEAERYRRELEEYV